MLFLCKVFWKWRGRRLARKSLFQSKPNKIFHENVFSTKKEITKNTMKFEYNEEKEGNREQIMYRIIDYQRFFWIMKINLGLNEEREIH